MNEKSKFALFFGNRGFFPPEYLKAARSEFEHTLSKLGHEYIMQNSETTRHGAVETPSEGRLYAKFLAENRGQYDGIILSLPNFGDETGAIAALEDCGVPILIQAYPDEFDKMTPQYRRDAFCGKLSIMDVFHQYGLPFTTLKPHTVHPSSDTFAGHIDYFDRLCRTVKAMKKMTAGAIGARTTAFKTVRIDEITLQKYGITVETFDMSAVFSSVRKLSNEDAAVKSKIDILRKYAGWDGVPDERFETLAKTGVVLDNLIEENNLDAIALRCWIEIQEELGVSPCVLMSEMGERGIMASCEMDIGNAVTMKALSAAAGQPATILDWNNNYKDEENKCILFHCGNVPTALMNQPGTVTDHAILKNSIPAGCSFGCNTGRIKPMQVTYGGLLTEDGKMKFYLGEGSITDDPIPEGFFGTAGVAEIPGLQDVLQTLGYLGHRHHVSLTEGRMLAPMVEAFEKYLGYEVTAF